MHREILTTGQKELLPLLKVFAKDFYLVGGTAVALYIGHRCSIDFDLFCSGDIHRGRIKNRIDQSGFRIDKVIHESHEQFHIVINGIKMTFFSFPFDVPVEERFDDVIKMPSLLTLAAMKAYALGGRAKWKDYADMFFLLKYHFRFSEISGQAKLIFKEMFTEKLFRQQLSYFKDIDRTEEIEYLVPAPSDEEIEQFLIEVALTPFT